MENGHTFAECRSLRERLSDTLRHGYWAFHFALKEFETETDHEISDEEYAEAFRKFNDLEVAPGMHHWHTEAERVGLEMAVEMCNIPSHEKVSDELHMDGIMTAPFHYELRCFNCMDATCYYVCCEPEHVTHAKIKKQGDGMSISYRLGTSVFLEDVCPPFVEDAE